MVNVGYIIRILDIICVAAGENQSDVAGLDFKISALEVVKIIFIKIELRIFLGRKISHLFNGVIIFFKFFL